MLGADTLPKSPAYWLFTTADINADYNAAVDELAKDAVIKSTDYWKSAIAHNTDVQGDWMASVITRMTNKPDLSSAVNALAAAGVIHDIAYWLANCIAGKVVAAANAKIIITDGVSKLKL